MDFDWDLLAKIVAAFTPFLLAILAGTGRLYWHEKERREAIEHQLSEKKHDTYVKLLKVFFDTMKALQDEEAVDAKKSMNEMFEASTDLIIYGSDDVIVAYQKWLDNSRKNMPGVLTDFAEIVVSIRRDMGTLKRK